MVIREKKIPTFSLPAILNVTGGLHSLSSFDICWNLLFWVSKPFSLPFFFHIWTCLEFSSKPRHTKAPVALVLASRKCQWALTVLQPGCPVTPEFQEHLTHHPPHPPCSPLCHFSPVCAHNQDPQIMQTQSHSHLLFLPRFDEKRAVQQLRACGVLETIRISAAGFPSRCVCSLWIASSCSSFWGSVHCWDWHSAFGTGGRTKSSSAVTGFWWSRKMSLVTESRRVKMSWRSWFRYWTWCWEHLESTGIKTVFLTPSSPHYFSTSTKY